MTSPQPAPTTAPVAPSLRALLGGAIDYAGLYPPASLDLASAVAEFATYRASPERWALGRFVIGADALDALARATTGQGLGDGWRISALLTGDVDAALYRVDAWNRERSPAGMRVDSIELRAASVEAIASIPSHAASAFECYVEIPVTTDPRPLVRALARLGARAKIRTGGVTGDAFPPAEQVLRFIRTCVDEAVPFKATAGLHHPLRGAYRLTYAPDSAHGTMFGFLNLMLATALIAHGGIDDATALAVLTESSPDAIRFDAHGVAWRDRRIPIDQLVASHAHHMMAFGSCSFREPIDDLDTLHLLGERP